MSVSAGPSAMSNSAKNHYLAGHYLVLVQLPSANSLRRPESGIADQFIISDLRNQIQQLKNQHHDHVEQIKHELGDKHQKELAEKELQYQKQTETKELTWRDETIRLVEQGRQETLADAERRWEVKVQEERLTWQQRVDALLHKVAILVAEKEKTDKNIDQEVESRIHATVSRYAGLQKETSSLQAVFELRCDEVRNLRHELEKVSASAVECSALRERNHTLLNTVEGLQAQLELKVNEDRRLRSEIGVLTSHYKDEVIKGRRLSMEKEELQYKLSLCCPPTANESEGNGVTRTRSSTLETPRHSMPILNLSPICRAKKSDAENNNNRNNNNNSRSPSETSDTADDDVFNSTSTTSTAATVRDFTEKNDSVAYVLDLGHSSPISLLPPPVSPWQRRRNLVRFSSLRWNKSTSH